MRAMWCWVAVVAGCGDNLMAPGPDAFETQQHYEPWVVGAEWTYRLSAPSGAPVGDYKTTVRPEAGIVGGPHDGLRTLLIHAEKLDGTKDVYEAYDGDAAVRYRSVFRDHNGTEYKREDYAPYRLKLSETAPHLVTGAVYSEQFIQTVIVPGQVPTTTMRTNTWRVIDAEVPITVLAGTFTALHVQRNNTKNIQDYWYVKGVGKVKETGGDQIEELVSYSIPSL